MTEKKRPTLYLLPNVLGDVPNHELYLPCRVDQIVPTLDGLIAESEKGGRRFLTRFKLQKPAHNIPIALLNEHTKDDELDFLLEPVRKKEVWAIISDAGMPCLADPGAKLIRRARHYKIHLEAVSGPSSITLGLLLSGLESQRFIFHGYPERTPEKRKIQLKQWEQHSHKEQYTQIFIEAPYRNLHTFQSLIETLSDETYLCVACDLTLPTEIVLTQRISSWRKNPLPNIEKKPTVFLFQRLRE